MNAKPDVFHGAERHQYHQVEQDIVPHIERLDFAGYTVIEGFLPTDRNDALRNAVRDVYDRQCADFGEDNLVRIGDAGVCRSPFMEDAVFREVLTDPFLMKVMRHYFGPLFKLNVNGASSARRTSGTRHPYGIASRPIRTSRPHGRFRSQSYSFWMARRWRMEVFPFWKGRIVSRRSLPTAMWLTTKKWSRPVPALCLFSIPRSFIAAVRMFPIGRAIPWSRSTPIPY